MGKEWNFTPQIFLSIILLHIFRLNSLSKLSPLKIQNSEQSLLNELNSSSDLTSVLSALDDDGDVPDQWGEIIHFIDQSEAHIDCIDPWEATHLTTSPPWSLRLPPSSARPYLPGPVPRLARLRRRPNPFPDKSQTKVTNLHWLLVSSSNEFRRLFLLQQVLRKC